jgi:superfamily II DNA or RNA helicase
MLAGGGKTFCAMNIINKIKLKTLIIVPNTYLLNQWVELLSKFFPNNKIGQYYGKKKEDGDIIVSIINSLVNDEYIFDEVIISDILCDNIKCNNIAKYNFEDESKPIFCTKHKCKNMIKIRNQKVTKNYIEFFKEFGFVILDESHIYCTDSFKIVYNRFQSTYMLGLSATPDERNNKCDIISHLNIGKVLKADEIEGYKKDNTKFNATVTLLRYNGPDEYVNTHINETTKMICVPKIIEDIINDPYRNQLIIDQLIELFNLKLNIFVFSERRSHLEHLYELFNTTIKKNNDNIDIDSNLSIPELNINNNIVLYGNSSDDDIDTAKNNSNIIFTTYAYSSTGISINRMTALILTTPRRSKSVQIIGRIFRLNDINNDEERIIIDLIDNKSVLKNQLYERMKAYKERDCIIQKKEINYNEINL